MLGMPGLLGYVQDRPLAEWWPHGGYRALSFGGRPDHLQGVIADAQVELLRLARRPPGMDDAVVVVASTDDPGKAGLLARRLGGLAFAAQTEAVVPPPAP